MKERLKQQLDFILEIDKEKNIFRQTHLSGGGRDSGLSHYGDVDSPNLSLSSAARCPAMVLYLP